MTERAQSQDYVYFCMGSTTVDHSSTLYEQFPHDFMPENTLKPLIQGFKDLNPTTPMPNKSPYLTALGCYLWYKNWAANQVPTAFSKPLKMELLKLALSICFTAVAFTLDKLDDSKVFTQVINALQVAGIGQNAQSTVSAFWKFFTQEDKAQLGRHQFILFHACIALVLKDPQDDFNEQCRPIIKAISDRMASAGPELEADGKTTCYPKDMEGAEKMILQLVLKYMATPREFHNPYSTLNNDKFHELLEGPRCQGETGSQIRNLAKVVLGAMNLGQEGNFIPRILMIGAFGTGKTSLVSELAEAMGAHLIRFNFRQVKADVDDHMPFWGYRSFEANVNIHMPSFDTPLLDAYRMSGVKNPWIFIDELPANTRLSSSLKDLLDQENSKLGHSVIFLASNDSLTKFDPALVERCIPVSFGSVSRHAKSVIYDEALKDKETMEHFTPLHQKKANELQDLNYDALSWKQVCDIIPPINKELSRSQLERQEAARVLSKIVVSAHKSYALDRDIRDGVRNARVVSAYIRCLVIGDYLLAECGSLPEESCARKKFAEEYLREEVRATIDQLSETGKITMSRLNATPQANPSSKMSDSDSGSDSDSDDSNDS